MTNRRPNDNSLNIEGDYYWVWCLSESDSPVIAEQTDHGWYLTGCETPFKKADIEIIKGPIQL